jgi:glycosyltransferase involved in cell wall biosynthesis
MMGQHCLLVRTRAHKAELVKDSLSIIFPVRNAEATLAGQVHELLDILPDLTSRFEILVIDDGSRDHTPDVAADLGRQYPQLRFLRLCEEQGHEAAIKLGVSRAIGQTLLIHEGNGRLSPTDLRRLWSLRHDRGLVMAHAQQPGVLSPDLVERLCTWGQTLRNLARHKQKAGMQMIRRDAAESLMRESAGGAMRSSVRHQ